jgi:ferrous iron transport protein A
VKRLLSELGRGERGVITRVGAQDVDELTRRLLEMGLLERSSVELVHEAPFGGDPIVVRARGALIALRRHEARHIEVDA